MDNTVEILVNSDSEDEIFFGAIRSPEKKKAGLLRNRKTEVFEAPLFVRRRSARPSLSSHVEEVGDQFNDQYGLDMENETLEDSTLAHFQADNCTSSFIDSQSSSLDCTKGSVNTQGESWVTDKENDVSQSKEVTKPNEEISIDEEVFIVEGKNKIKNVEVRLADSITSEVSTTESYGEKIDDSLETSNADSHYEYVKNTKEEILTPSSLADTEDTSTKDVCEIENEKEPLFVRSDLTRKIDSNETEILSFEEKVEADNNISVEFDNESQDEIQNVSDGEILADPIISKISNADSYRENFDSTETNNTELEYNLAKNCSKEYLPIISSSHTEDQTEEDYSEITKENGPLFIRPDIISKIGEDKENSPIREGLELKNKSSISVDNESQRDIEDVETAEISEDTSSIIHPCSSDTEIKELPQVREKISTEDVCIVGEKDVTEGIELADYTKSEVSVTESYNNKIDYSMENSNIDSQYNSAESSINKSVHDNSSEHIENLQKDLCEIGIEKEPLFVRTDITREIISKKVEISPIPETFESEAKSENIENIKTVEFIKDSSLALENKKELYKEEEKTLEPICDETLIFKTKDNIESKSRIQETDVIASVVKENLCPNQSIENKSSTSPDLKKDISAKACSSDGSTAIRAKPRESFFTSLEVIDVDNDEVYEGFMTDKSNGLLSDDSVVSGSIEKNKFIDQYKISHQSPKTPVKKQTPSKYNLDNSMEYESSPVTPPPGTVDKGNENEEDNFGSDSFTKPTSFINWTRTKSNTISPEEIRDSDSKSTNVIKNTSKNILVDVDGDQVSILTIDSQDSSKNQLPGSLSSIDSYGDINKAMANSKTHSLNSENNSSEKAVSPNISNAEYQSPMAEYERRNTEYYTAREEVEHLDSSIEDVDHLDKSVESLNSDNSPKRVFNDTIEEMEMLLKYGVNYSDAKKKDDERNNLVSESSKEVSNYDDGNYSDSCSDEEVVIVPSPRKNSVASIVSNFQPVLDSTRADFTKLSAPVDSYSHQPWEPYKAAGMEPWKPYEKIQNISCGSPEIQVLCPEIQVFSPVEIIRKKPPTKPPRNVNSPLLNSPKLTPNGSRIPSPSASLAKYSLSPNLTPGGSRRMSPLLVNSGIKSSLTSPRVSPSTPNKTYSVQNTKQGTPRMASSKVPNSSPYTTPRSTTSRVLRDTPIRTTTGKLGGSARKAGTTNRGTNLVRTGSLTNLADNQGPHSSKNTGSQRLPSNATRVGMSSIPKSGVRTKDALPPRPTPSKQPTRAVNRQPSHTSRHVTTPQSKTTRVGPTTPLNNKLSSPAMRAVNQATKTVGGLSIVSPVAKYLQSNPPPQLVVNIQSKPRSSPKSNNSPTTTKIPSPISAHNVFDNSGMERQIRLDKIQHDMEKLNQKMQTQVSRHSPKDSTTSGRKKKVKVALPNNIVYKPALVHMENKENEGYRRREIQTNKDPVKIIKHQGRIQLPADVYIDDDGEDCVSPVGVVCRSRNPLMTTNMVDMSVLEPHNVQHTNTISNKMRSRVNY